MYCHHCERRQPDDAVYCCYCGRLLDIKEGYEAEAAAGTEYAAKPPNPEGRVREHKAGSQWIWLTPLICAVLVMATLIYYYQYEKGLNEQVASLHKQAQVEALEGKYAQAAATLDEAIGLREDHVGLRADMAIVVMAAKLEHSLMITGKQLDEKDAEGARKGLDAVADNLGSRKEPMFDRLQEQLLGQQERLMALRMSLQLHEIHSIEDLGYALSTLSGLGSKEAIDAREGLIGRIVSITDTSGRLLLKKKKFNDAIMTVNKGLEYAKYDESLLALLEEIKLAKEKYEHNEQLRLEQAMQNAAAEDLKNQTAAVEVLHVESFIDAEGRFTVQGELRNAATRPIYRVSVEFTVYNEAGEKLASGMAEASPEYAELGEKLNFYNDEIELLEEQTTVTIDNVTWYLD